MPDNILIQVILPLRLGWEPCYWAPDSVSAGDRVLVSFARRQYVAVVHRVGVEADFDLSKVQAVLDIDTGLPPITSRELEFWEFISLYYLCSIGEVYYAAYPYNKVNSEKVAVRAAQAAGRRIGQEQAACMRRLERVEGRIEVKAAVLAARKASSRASADVTARLEHELGELEKQRADLQHRIGALAARMPEAPCLKSAPASHEPSKPALLQSSSRIQTYKKAIRETVAEGRQVLVLTPDILYCRSVSASIAEEYPQMQMFTSKETPATRRRIADRVRDGSAEIIVGTRNAIFLPFSDLGLIIVDEEQDTFYKQEDTAPRYNGRDCAVKLASIHCSRVILGSSCPSLETLLNARCGRYRVLEGSGPVPCGAVVIDIAAEKRKRGVTGAFTFKLIEAVRRTPGKVVLIRGWERPEDLSAQIEELFPGRDIPVMRYLQARDADLSDTGLVAVLQADALVDDTDFRADEKAAQIVSQLVARCRTLVVQTNVVSRFDGSRTIGDLLDERRDFGFPPYTRAVELRRRGSSEATQRFFLKKDASLAARKAEIAGKAGKDEYVDVDPL